MKLKFLFLFLVTFLIRISAMAQCAMCRASVENNVSNGETSIGAGLNLGILYLLMMPYLIALVIGVLWYRASKKKKAKAILR
ncbi:MAG: hypothetical protein ACKO44_11460 [Algoriphagus sp.]